MAKKKTKKKKVEEKVEVSRKEIDGDHIEITFNDGSVEVRLV